MPGFVVRLGGSLWSTKAAVLPQVVSTGSVQGVMTDSVGSEHTVTCQAPQHSAANVVAIALPGHPPDRIATPAQEDPSASTPAFSDARDSSMTDELLPVGVTTYTEVSTTRCFCGLPSQHHQR